MVVRIIDFVIGVLICVFGSYRWKLYIGIFIKKVIIDRVYYIVNDLIDLLVVYSSFIFGIDREDFDMYMVIRLISSGRELNSV